MRKNDLEQRLVNSPQVSDSSRSKVAVAIIIGVVLTPLVIEFGMLYYAKWSAIMGRSTDVANTPIIDWIQATFTSGCAELARTDSRFFQKVADAPKFGLLVASLLLTLGMYCLKRSHSAR